MGVSTSESQEDEKPTRVVERQNDWRAPTQEPPLEKDEEEVTEPPQLRR